MGIKLVKKQISDGRYSLYLSICINGKRKKEALGIILEKERDKETKELNKIKLSIARSMQIKKELDYLLNKVSSYAHTTQANKQNCKTENKDEKNLFEIYSNYIDCYKKADIRILKASYQHLYQYSQTNYLPLSSINKNFCNNYLDYLYKKLRGNTPSLYFKKFKTILNLCLEEGYIEKNPAINIHPVQRHAVTKEILTPSEIEKLALTLCDSPQVKRAFLFSCHSGLRWCDIKQLKFENIDFSRNILRVVQKKVSNHSCNAVLFLNLNSSAMMMIGKKPTNNNEYIFNLPSHATALHIINKWTKKAGIQKHISFHCARHTFITMLINNGVGIKTTSSLAGHSSTRHTEKYIHIIDPQKEEAVNKLPELPANTIF